MTYQENIEDVLGKWLEWSADACCALVVVTNTHGGGVRAPGAMLAVSEGGGRAGYISGGCIDADVVRRAREALASRKVTTLRYGTGSPYLDLPLPCGGAIDVLILPNPDPEVVRACRDRLMKRECAVLGLSRSGDLSFGADTGAPDFKFRYLPRLRLRIAGRGADPLALAQLARASGIDTQLLLRDGMDVDEAAELGFVDVSGLTTPGALPESTDDPWTAFLLAFHDTDWENQLLTQALSGPAFFVGAVGSRNTHASRCERLRVAGIEDWQIKRIRGPVGMIPAMRDASMLAVSILAEIVDAYHQKKHRPFADTAIVLLAAGQSKRFEDGDKLLAPLRGKRVIDHAGALLNRESVAGRIAVVGAGDDGRADALRAAGWNVIENENAHAGQATSLAAGIRATSAYSGVRSALVLLADMPNVTDAHLLSVREALTPDRSAVMSQDGDTLLPPAIFASHLFGRLSGLTGDAGAARVFSALGNTATVLISAFAACDIDTRADLSRMESLTVPH